MKGENTTIMLDSLRRAGISREDSYALRRISMTLHRWHELECGGGNDYASWSIERDEHTGIPYMCSYPNHGGQVVRRKTPDRETGALRRLKEIMARINSHEDWCATASPISPGEILEHGPCNCGRLERGILSAYVQTDPRGASLYILRPGDVPEGCEVDCYYSRGLAVYK